MPPPHPSEGQALPAQVLGQEFLGQLVNEMGDVAEAPDLPRPEPLPLPWPLQHDRVQGPAWQESLVPGLIPCGTGLAQAGGEVPLRLGALLVDA